MEHEKMILHSFTCPFCLTVQGKKSHFPKCQKRKEILEKEKNARSRALTGGVIIHGFDNSGNPISVEQ